MKSDHVRLVGGVIPALTRAAKRLNTDAPTTQNGLPILPNERSPDPVTLDLVNQLRDDQPL